MKLLNYARNQGFKIALEKLTCLREFIVKRDALLNLFIIYVTHLLDFVKIDL